MEGESTRASKADYLAESTIGDRGRRATKISSKARSPSFARSALDLREVRDRIAKKAYALYQERGEVHGHDVDDWLEAEQIILAELNSESSTLRRKKLRRRPPP